MKGLVYWGIGDSNPGSLDIKIFEGNTKTTSTGRLGVKSS